MPAEVEAADRMPRHAPPPQQQLPPPPPPTSTSTTTGLAVPHAYSAGSGVGEAHQGMAVPHAYTPGAAVETQELSHPMSQPMSQPLQSQELGDSPPSVGL